MKPKDAKLYDVLIYHIETRMVVSIVGKGLTMDTGFTNAERRLATAYDRIGDDYNACIVAANKYAVNDKLKRGD